MAPKARSRKPGTSRMDAAIDQMRQFGFHKDRVRRKMNGLLKVYGGDAGYPFIEADAYQVLIDALIEDQMESGQEERNVEKCAEGETSMKNDLLGNEIAANTQILNNALQADDGQGNDCPLLAEGDERSWKDIGTCSEKEIMRDNNDRYSQSEEHHHEVPICSPPPSVITSPPKVQNLRTRRRRPCYG